MKNIKPPEPLEVGDSNCVIFLAGSIEMDKAERWQDKVTDALKETKATILNPRRDSWDSSWKQEKSNPQFREQVTWEMSGLDKADIIVFYFSPETMSPISLLELGLYAGETGMLVCCPEGFWRKGNVDMVCEKYGIHQVDSLDALIKELVEVVNVLC